MATRVNTKFVIVLSSIIVLLVAAFAGLYYFKVLRSPQEMIRRGDLYMAQGQPELAVAKYGRALSQRHDDIDLIHKYLHALRIIDVKDIVQARQYLGQIRDWTRTASELRPQDPKLLDDFYSFMLSMAQDSGGRGWYDELYRMASAKLAKYPDNLIAHKYRGIAQVHRLRSDMPRDQQLQAQKDLLTYYAKHPEDAEASHALSLWLLWEADQLEGQSGTLASTQKQIKDMRDKALELSKRMLGVKPDDLHRKLYHLRILLDPAIHDTKAARPIVDQIEAALMKKPEPEKAVVTLAQRLPELDTQKVERKDLPDTTQGIQRAQKLLEAAVAARPASVRYHFMLGQILAREGLTKQAADQFGQAWEQGVHAPAVQAVEAYGRRISARLAQLNLQVAQADQAKDAKARDAQLTQIEQRLADVENLAGKSGATQLIRGKIALARHQYTRAMQDLDKASDQLGGHNLQALLLSARARELAGERGAAIEQLQKAAALAPDLANVRLELAKLYLQTDQADQAQRVLKNVLSDDANNPEAMLLEASLLARQGHLDQALAAYQKLDPAKYPQVVAPLASLYVRQGHKDKARKLFLDLFEKNPANVRVLTPLLKLTTDPKQRAQLIDQSRKAGGSEAVLTLLETQNEAGQSGHDIDQQALIDQLVEQQKDPLKRELLQAQLYSKTGNEQKTLAALAQAAKIDPDNPQVVAMQFDAALRNRKWDDAEKLAAKAGSLNLDLVSGAFFRGRLAAARGRLDEAAAEYHRGLDARPVYSEGWRRMGDVQMRNHNLEAAQDAYQRAVDQRPDNIKALRGLAAVADAQGDHDHALSLLKDALKHDPSNAQLLDVYLDYEQRYGDAAQALKLRQQLAKANPADVNNRRSLALLLAQQGKTDQAVRTIQALIKEHGTTRTSVAALASIYAQAKEPDKGAQALEHYIQTRGDKADVDDLLTLAHFNLAVGDSDGALKAYARARKLEDPKRQKATRDLADVLFARGMVDKALPLYQDLYRKHPDEQRIALRLSETLLRSGKFDDAKKLADKYPDVSQAQALLGMIALKQNQTDQATTAFNQALTLDPRNTDAMVQLAGIYAADPSQSAQAKQLLTKALSINANLVSARMALVDLHLKLGEAPEAVRELRTLLAHHPDRNPARLKLMRLYLDQGDTASATSLIQDAAKRQPKDPAWPRLLSQLAMRSGDTAEAIREAKQMVELAPTAAHLGTLSSLLLNDKQASAALDVLEKHIGVVNKEPVLQAVRARGLAATGKVDQAKQLFAHAIERAGNLSQLDAAAQQMAQAYGVSEAITQLSAMKETPHPLWLQLVLAQLDMTNRQYAQAADRLRSITPELPADDKPLLLRHHRMLAMSLYQSGAYAEAKKAYEQVLKLAPNDLGTLNNLAYLLVEDLNQPEEGLKMAQRAAAQSPGNPQVLDTLGWAQFKAGKIKDARQTLQGSIDLQPLAPNCYHLAVVYHKLGMADQARDTARQAVELAKKSDDDVLTPATKLLGQLGKPQ